MAKFLSNLLKKNLSFEWKKKQHRAFKDLKEIFLFTFVLKFPNFIRLFKVHANASDFVIRGVIK